MKRLAFVLLLCACGDRPAPFEPYVIVEPRRPSDSLPPMVTDSFLVVDSLPRWGGPQQ